MNVYEPPADDIESVSHLLYLHVGAVALAGEAQQTSVLGIALRHIFLGNSDECKAADINSMGISLSGPYSNDTLTPQDDTAGIQLREASSESGQRLHDLFTRYIGITLLFDGNQSDAELAAIIAREVKRAGRHVVAIQTSGEALPVEGDAWRALNCFADLAVHMPGEEQSPVMLADMIWSSLVLQGPVCVDFFDFFEFTKESGWGHIAILPVDVAALRNYGQSSEGFATARKFIWLNIHCHQGLSLDQFTLSGDCIASIAPNEVYLAIGVPFLENEAATIPEGLVVFHA